MSVKRFNSALAPFVMALVRAGGGDASRLEKRFKAEISLPELGALLDAASGALNDPLFGLHCAQAMPRGSYGLLEFALRAAPTGKKAMEQLAAYGALINPLVRWTVEEEGAEVAIHHRAPRKDGVGRQANIFTVARIVTIAREMLGDDVVPTAAWFAHREKDCPLELREHLRANEVRFGAASNGVAFAAAALERTPTEADPELNRALETYASALLVTTGTDEIYELARRVVRELLPRGEATLEKTAKRLHLTARTLQRRLTGEGIAFGALLDDVRRAQAERLLARSEVSLGEVAAAVGYSDDAVFSRAFKKWSGVTPGQYRSAVMS